MNDRVLGALGLGLAGFFVWRATLIELSFISDPVGPRTFPIIICAGLALASLAMLLKPDAAPEWPAASRLFEIAYAKPPKVPRGIRRQVVEAFYADNTEEREALLDALVGSIEELRVIEWTPDQPTLVIWGRDDRVFPLPASDRLLAELGELAELVIIEDAGHAPNLERPKPVNRAMLEFLARDATPI